MAKLVTIIALNQRAVYTPSAPITEPASGRWRWNSHRLIYFSYGLQHFLVILITEQPLQVLLKLAIRRAGVFSQDPKDCLKKTFFGWLASSATILRFNRRSWAWSFMNIGDLTECVNSSKHESTVAFWASSSLQSRVITASIFWTSLNKQGQCKKVMSKTKRKQTTLSCLDRGL